MKISSLALVFCAAFIPSTQAENNRIISASSTVTELLFALGADAHVVGVDLSSRQALEGRDIPVLGYHRQLSAESILALNPTTLVGSPEMGPENILTLIKAAGVNITSLPSEHTREDFYQRIDTLAALTNTKENGEKIKTQVTQKMDALQKSAPKNKPKVLFMLFSQGRPISVAGSNTTVNAVIELAGATNPAAKQSRNFKPLSIEAIVQMQPDYILLAQRTFEQFKGIEGLLKEHPLLKATPALQKSNVLPISSHAILGGFGLASLSLAKTLNEEFSLRDKDQRHE